MRDKNLNWSTGFLGNRQQQVLLNGIISSKLSVDYTEESFRPNLILIIYKRLAGTCKLQC
jgi:hypothetical protein